MSRITRKPTVWTCQPKHATQANPDGQVSPPVDFLFQELLLCTAMPLRRNVLAQIIRRALCRLIWVDALPRVNNVCFLVEWLI